MPAKLSISSSDPLSLVSDLTVIGVPEGAKVEEGFLAQLSKALGPVVAKNLKRDEFTGKKDQVADFQTNGAVKPARIVVMGLGKGPFTDGDDYAVDCRGPEHLQLQRRADAGLDEATLQRPRFDQGLAVSRDQHVTHVDARASGRSVGIHAADQQRVPSVRLL